MLGGPFSGSRDGRRLGLGDEFSGHPYLRHVPRLVKSPDGRWVSIGEIDAGLKQHVESFLLPDGRTMWFGVRGRGPRKVLYIPGMPGCVWGPAPDEWECIALGFQLFIPEGAGYGLSTPNPGHTVADGARDIRALVDHLERSGYIDQSERLIVAGRSRGGVYAEAFASMYPERTLALATICSATSSLGGEGLAESNWLAQTNQLEEIWSEYEEKATRLKDDPWSHLDSVVRPQASEGDREYLQPQPVGFFMGDTSAHYAVAFCHYHAVFTYGARGWFDDIYALWHHPRGLGFDNSYSVPRIHWQGGKDVFAVEEGALQRAERQNLPILRIKNRDSAARAGYLPFKVLCSEWINALVDSDAGALPKPPLGCTVVDVSAGHFTTTDVTLDLLGAVYELARLPTDVARLDRSALRDLSARRPPSTGIEYTWHPAVKMLTAEAELQRTSPSYRIC